MPINVYNLIENVANSECIYFNFIFFNSTRVTVFKLVENNKKNYNILQLNKLSQ